MASQNSVDWAKAAAAWASQRQRMQQENKQQPLSDIRPTGNVSTYPQMLNAMNYSAAQAMTPNPMMLIPGFNASVASAMGSRLPSHYGLFHPSAMGTASAAMYAQFQQKQAVTAHHHYMDATQASYPSWYLNSSGSAATNLRQQPQQQVSSQQQTLSQNSITVTPISHNPMTLVQQSITQSSAMTQPPITKPPIALSQNVVSPQTSSAPQVVQPLQQHHQFTLSKPPMITHQKQQQISPTSASISQPPLFMMPQQMVAFPHHSSMPTQVSPLPSAQIIGATTAEPLAALDLKKPSDNLDELVDSAGINDETVSALVKKSVEKVLSTVTDTLLETFSKEILTEIQSYQAQNKDRLNSNVLTQNRNSASLPSQNTHALQLQLSFAARPVQPVLLGEAGLALEEDHDDLREDEENNNLPFIVFEAPPKGLFKTPPEGITLLPEENLRTKEQTIRVVCYTRRGKPLGEIELNNRQTIIFGSNSRQANIIDSHPSVYSQHCAIGVCAKAPAQKPAVVSCSLFLFPLGGTTKMYNPEQIPFLQPLIEQEESEDKLPPPVEKPTIITEPPVDVIVDGDRKRKIMPGKQVFLQLSSSQRYYMIDASCWNKTHVMLGPDYVPTRFYSSESLERLNSEQSTDAPVTSSPASLLQTTKSAEHSKKKRNHVDRRSRSPRRTKRADQRDSSFSSEKRRRRHHVSASRRGHSLSRHKSSSQYKRQERFSRKREESLRKRDKSSSRRRRHKRKSSHHSHSTPR